MKGKHDFGICLGNLPIRSKTLKVTTTTTQNPLRDTILTQLTTTGLSRARARIQAGAAAPALLGATSSARPHSGLYLHVGVHNFKFKVI